MLHNRARKFLKRYLQAKLETHAIHDRYVKSEGVFEDNKRSTEFRRTETEGDGGGVTVGCVQDEGNWKAGKWVD